MHSAADCLAAGKNKAPETSLYLVSCVGEKLAVCSPARDLYVSAWFEKARAFVEAAGGSWFILSAKHGLVAPEEPIEPYDLTLNRMPADERRKWADGVFEQLVPRLGGGRTVVFLAGKRYQEFLVDRLVSLGVRVDVPMQHMGIGQQLSWLGKRGS